MLYNCGLNGSTVPNSPQQQTPCNYRHTGVELAPYPDTGPVSSGEGYRVYGTAYGSLRRKLSQ